MQMLSYYYFLNYKSALTLNLTFKYLLNYNINLIPENFIAQSYDEDIQEYYGNPKFFIDGYHYPVFL